MAFPSRRASCRASSMVSPVKPKASFPFSEPAMDWKIRSAGAPLRTHSIWVVTWASTQIWVGISQRLRISWNRSSTRVTLSTESSTGLSPSTASPMPKVSPSSREAMMPSGSSVGWLGWRRAERVPGSPMVVLQVAVTRSFRAA